MNPDQVQAILGEPEAVMADLQHRMMAHAERMEYEKAAEFRNQISALSTVLHQQSVDTVMDKDVDVLAVKAAAKKAADHARSGKGPYILEMKTYRYRGHSMSDPAKYRSRDEVQAVRDNSDPIEGLKTELEAVGEAGAGVDHHAGRIDLAQKALRMHVVARQDGVGVVA